MITFRGSDLDEFVRKTDLLGGPNSSGVAEYWSQFCYEPSTPVDQNIDPFSDEYFEQQIRLYEEIASRQIDPVANEQTTIDIERHTHAANPYALRDPSAFAMHYLRLGFAIKNATLPENPSVLDMGAGWGLSSEFLATLGCRVTAMDINPAFIELINRRAARLQLPITAVLSTFDTFEPNEQYNAVVFYECLHHATRPWDLINRASKWLIKGGKIVFAGEPVNSVWWRNWGIRLDPLSVYCVRKFGWFESGWSKDFIIACFQRSGMIVSYVELPVVGSVCVAEKVDAGHFMNPDVLSNFIIPQEWYSSKEYLVTRGSSALTLEGLGAGYISFEIHNFRPKPIPLNVLNDDVTEFSGVVEPGHRVIRCRLKSGITRLRFISETWIPGQEIGNSDGRELSLHIAGATLD